MFLVWGLRGEVQEVVGRKRLQNKGFRSKFALWYLVHLHWTRCIASMLHKFFENNFWGSHKFVFSEVRIFDQIGFGRQKTALGCRTEVVLKLTFFPFFPGGDQFVRFLARFRTQLCCGLGSSRAVARNLLAAAVRMVFPCFPGLFFRHCFCEFEKGSFEIPPSLLFVFCSFLRFLLEFGSTQPCTCVLGQLALNLSFLFVLLFVSLQKHFFLLKKGHFCSFLCVSLSFSLASVSLFLLFFLFPSLFFCFFL